MFTRKCRTSHTLGTIISYITKYYYYDRIVDTYKGSLTVQMTIFVKFDAWLILAVEVWIGKNAGGLQRWSYG